MSGPREEDGDYAREFFDGYEREADRAAIKSFVTAVRAQTTAERERDEARAEVARLTVEQLTYLEEYRRYREAAEADMALIQARHDDALAALADMTDPDPS